MTCLLNLYGRISNLENIIQYLAKKDDGTVSLGRKYSDSNSDEAETPNDEWSNDWGWDKSSDKQSISKPKEKSSNLMDKKENWFDMFRLSFSPCGNLLCLASKHDIIICQGKWDMNNQIKYTFSSRIELNENEKEYVTAIICIPIASQRISGEGLVEWTCIMVGFNTGNIRMYTENGTLLITQMFHNEPVTKIKCRTFEPAKYIGWISQPEEIEIMYNNNVLVCIDGANLYHYLRAARKYAANCDHNEMIEMISSLNLDYKKWKMDMIETLNDFVSSGMTSENRFDQLFAASMIGGPDGKFASIPPISNRYMTCGNAPYISFYHALEGQSQPVLSEVKAAAGKLTSSLINAAKGWIPFSKSSTATTTKPKPKIEPDTPLDPRFSLKDLRRSGESLIIAPANNLAATTDSFARVILIDVQKGIAVRVFKGYRDAQIGWICVDDESEEKNNKRYALYLIIYAPRRGLLEIWGCQQGIRVAAFNVGKNSKLIYPGYYMLSLNGSLLIDQNKFNQHIQCFLLNSDGTIKTVQIPFHLILSDKSNQRVRDTILLKKVKSILRQNTSDSESLWNNLILVLNEFKTPSIKQQALEKILTTNYLDAHKIYDIFNKQLDQIDKQGDNLSSDSYKLGQFCRFNCRLLSSYIFIIDLEKSTIPIAYNSEIKDSDIESLSNSIKIDESDLKNYFDLKKTIISKQKRVLKAKSESESTVFDFPKFISCFEYIANNTQSDYSRRKYFDLNKRITIKDKQQLGAFLFGALLNTEPYDANLFRNFMNTIPLGKIQLLDLLVYAWLSQSYENISSLFKFIFILSSCSAYTNNHEYEPSTPIDQDSFKFDTESIRTGYSFGFDENLDEDDFETNFASEYLIKFKNTCENSSSLLNALLLSWVIRSILLQAQFETTYMENLKILSDRLFSLVKLNILFLCGDRSILETFDINVLTIKNIINKGKGFISEIVSRHIVLNEFSPKLMSLIDNEENDEEIIKDQKVETDLLLKNEVFKEFYDCLQETRKYLPKSLESDTLLANSAWESIIIYNRESETEIKHLEISLRHCGEIGNAILKQGILSMIWHNHLCKKVSLLTDLIDKVGKLPKDKQLRKDVGINEDSVLKFLECIMTFLDLIMDANCSMNEVPIFNYDQFWKDQVDTLSDITSISTNMILSLASNTSALSVEKPKSASKQLVELAAEQKHINYNLCSFHYQLIRILYLIAKYNMKSVKPYAFFDTKGKHTLFSELHTHPLISNDVDIKILNARKLFFTKALNAIMEHVEYPTNLKSKLSQEISSNLNIVFNLTKDMGVDNEYIKRYYCCMLYALDYHGEAEKILQSIKEGELMASQLLVVIGTKINQILESNFDASLIAILSTNLRSWLKSLGSSDFRIYTLPSKQGLLELMGIVLNKLPDTFAEHKLAVELFDFIDNAQFQIKK